VSQRRDVSPGRPRRGWLRKTITVPDNLDRACNEFNARKYFECHETLEEIWQEERGEVRDLYKGLIQAAAAMVHVSRANVFGATRLSMTALGYLAPYRAEGALGFDVEGICRGAADCLDQVRALGRDGIERFDYGRAPVWAVRRELLSQEARRWRAWGFDDEGTALEMEIAVPE
jgi:hypothetical protein